MSRGKWSEEKKKAWSEKCKATGCNIRWTVETFKKFSEAAKKNAKNLWTPEQRKKHSKIMKKTVKLYPESYSKNNVSGRAKLYDVISPKGKTKVKGKWELKVAEYLNNNNINWTNDIEPYKYFWNSSWHLYYPDFHLLNNDILIEVKGYETERDIFKWKAVKDKKLLIVKKNEIKDLKNFFEKILL
jgi:hypothetical protein